MARPDQVLELYEDGLAAIDEGDLDRARKLCEEARMIAPDDAQVHLLDGEIASQEDRSEDAIECFERAIVAAPGWPEACAAAAREEPEADDPSRRSSA
jgi:tetratricopeptide (TPR) repeat protein